MTSEQARHTTPSPLSTFLSSVPHKPVIKVVTPWKSCHRPWGMRVAAFPYAPRAIPGFGSLAGGCVAVGRPLLADSPTDRCRRSVLSADGSFLSFSNKCGPFPPFVTASVGSVWGVALCLVLTSEGALRGVSRPLLGALLRPLARAGASLR